MAEIDRLLKGLLQHKGSDLHLASAQSVRMPNDSEAGRAANRRVEVTVVE